VTDAVEISMEAGRIVLTAPDKDDPRITKVLTVREVANRGIKKYRTTLDVLAGEDAESRSK